MQMFANGTGCDQKGRASQWINQIGVSSLFPVLLMGCGTMSGTPCGNDERRAVQELVYFGAETPSGHVTSEDWASFLSEVVTPRFPEGLSAWEASGQWRSASGQVIREPSHLLSLVHSGSAAQNRAIQELIETYKARFHQEAVLPVSSVACASL